MKTKLPIATSIVIIFLAIYYSLTSLSPQFTSDIDVPDTEFSTQRALNQLKQISKKPHYIGTDEHKNVKTYLIKELKDLGLDVQTQEQVAINKKWRGATVAQNIIARIKGKQNGKALLLLSHYDSAVHSSLGASDDGSGVVTILESIRAFMAKNKQPNNDIIILFSDAEEVGLLGASAFVNHHQWAKDVGLVINFEARGSGGPSYMLLETNGGNKKLITAFIQSHPAHPIGNSLMYSIYKMLPNDTDLTVFREESNINGFNFAFIDDHFDYHTSQDSYKNLNKNSLKHQGEYLMALLNLFSDYDLNSLNDKADNVYFNFSNLMMISYPFSWTLGMFIFAFIFFIGVLTYGIKTNQLNVSEIFKGFIPFISALLLSVVLTFLGWKFVLIIHPQYNDILHGFTYNGHIYIMVFVCFSLFISFLIYARYFKKYSSKNLMIAPLFFWLIINLLIVLYLKGAAFFIFPVYLALISLIILFLKTKSSTTIVINTLLFVPALIIFVPLIKMFPVGLGLKMLGISSFFVVLIFGLMIPVFKKYKTTKQLTIFFGVLTLLFLVIGAFTSSYNVNRKQPVSLNYVYDAINNKSYFVSYDQSLNSYNKKYLGTHPTKGNFEKTALDSKYHTKINYYTETKLTPLSVPIILITKDTIIEGLRHVSLQITPQRSTNKIDLIAQNNFHFNSFTVNGEPLKSKNKYVIDTKEIKNIISYYFTTSNEILNISFSFPKNEKPDILIYDIAYDLFTNPLLNVEPYKDSTMFSMPFVVNDASIIKTKLNL